MKHLSSILQSLSYVFLLLFLLFIFLGDSRAETGLEKIASVISLYALMALVALLQFMAKFAMLTGKYEAEEQVALLQAEVLKLQKTKLEKELGIVESGSETETS